MKISICIAVYNEEKNILNLLESIKSLDFARDSFELNIVNDGSIDNTGDVIKKWILENKDIQINYLLLLKNEGRMIAREKCAQMANFENILITDARCALAANALKIIEAMNYQPIIGNPIQSQNGLIGRFFFLLRAKLYKNSFGDEFSDVFINKDNFDGISKGTTILFVNKDLFLKHISHSAKGKYANDDTKILRSIIEEKKILKSSALKCYYSQRENLLAEIMHTFNRGPRFIDYYYNRKSKYFYFINLSIALFLMTIFFAYYGFYSYIIIILFIVNIVTAFYLSKNIKDFLISFFIFPIIAISFFTGIIEGLILKVFKTY